MSSEVQTTTEEKAAGTRRSSGNVMGALILIGLGVIFLLQRVGNFSLDNWWALFILIPAFGAFASAYRIWRSSGRLSYGVWTTFFGGLFPLLVAAMFLFELDWGVYWPFFIILPGIGMLINGLAFRRTDGKTHIAVFNAHRPWLITIGASAIGLGLMFVLQRMGRLDPTTLIPFEQWWGVFILIPAVGGLLATFLLLAGGRSASLIIINLVATAAVAMAGMVALLNFDWNVMNYVLPIALILIGAGVLFNSVARGNRGSTDSPV